MADVELVVEGPDVGFHADAAGFDGGVERDAPPVVVMRVAWYREDVAGEVGRVVRGSLADLAWFAPILKYVVDTIWKDGERKADEKSEELEDSAGHLGKLSLLLWRGFCIQQQQEAYPKLYASSRCFPWAHCGDFAMSAGSALALLSSSSSWRCIRLWKLDVGHDSLPKGRFCVVGVLELHAMIQECRRS